MFKTIIYGGVTFIWLLHLCNGAMTDHNGTKTKDLRFKLRSGDLMPAVGCTFYIKNTTMCK